jgi:phospholipase C
MRATTIVQTALVLFAFASGPTQSADAAARVTDEPFAPIKHVIVLYLENRSFDNLYGEFPGADGLKGLKPAQYQQVDGAGTPYRVLPQAPGSPLPLDLPNAPFAIERFVPADSATGNPTHLFYHQQLQIDGGKMDRFAVVSGVQGLTMGYYHTMALPLAAEAQKYTLADHFFHSAFGGSFLNHMYFISAAVPVFPNAPFDLRAQTDAQGNVTISGSVSPDGYGVNTLYSTSKPNLAGIPDDQLLPPQTMPTIGDRLSEHGVSWAWYSGGWNDAIAGHPSPLFENNHQPFVYFARYAEGTPGRKEHLLDEEDFIAAARAGTLPAVSFVKPLGTNDEHPGYTDLISGERHTIELINAIRNGPNWKDAAIIITYDENGGFWDHVPPPKGDRWGPGARVPTIIISPFAKKGFVDHTTYETLSILALIEHRFGLAPLGTRDAAANDMRGAFTF